jgi:hypothetical protein
MNVGSLTGQVGLSAKSDAQGAAESVKRVYNPGDELDLTTIETMRETCRAAQRQVLEAQIPTKELPPGMPKPAVIAGFLSIYDQSWLTAFINASHRFLVLRYKENEDATED